VPIKLPTTFVGMEHSTESVVLPRSQRWDSAPRNRGFCAQVAPTFLLGKEEDDCIQGVHVLQCSAVDNRRAYVRGLLKPFLAVKTIAVRR